MFFISTVLPTLFLLFWYNCLWIVSTQAVIVFLILMHILILMYRLPKELTYPKVEIEISKTFFVRFPISVEISVLIDSSLNVLPK